MKTWVITLTHLDLPILEKSLEAFKQTASMQRTTHILCDHHWPIDYWNHRRSILTLAEKHGCKVMAPFQNRGAHGGYNWVLNNIPIEDDDMVICFDGDSMPLNPGWDEAMRKVMEQDPEYGALFLSFNFEVNCKNWVLHTTRAGINIVKPQSGIEMINVSAWRYSFLKRVGLFQANYKYYGQVEGPMFEHLILQGLKWGYLDDYKEGHRPGETDPRYRQWKADHLTHKFSGNFEEWLCQHQS